MAEAADQTDLTLFRRALGFSERVVERSKEHHSGLDFLYGLFSAMVFNVGQRLIDAKTQTGERFSEDEALIILCNRLFNDSFSGYLLLKRGLIGPASLLLRSALEVTNLAVLLGGSPEHAERWLGGREYTPAVVRRLLESTDAEREWYSKLSKATHANYVASRANIYRVEETTTDVLMYGGRFAPKESGLTGCAFLWLHLTFLQAFYARSSGRLAALGLLWKPGMHELLEERDLEGLSWQQVLEVFASVLSDVQGDLEKLPPDHDDIPPMVAEHFA